MYLVIYQKNGKQKVEQINAENDRGARMGKVNMTCPHCNQELSREEIARLFSQISSDAKRKASAENGKKGGRPKKVKNETPNI